MITDDELAVAVQAHLEYILGDAMKAKNFLTQPEWFKHFSAIDRVVINAVDDLREKLRNSPCPACGELNGHVFGCSRMKPALEGVT